MKPDKSQSAEAVELRRKAEASLLAELVAMQPPQNEAETQRLLYELQIHQIELEMQNAELRQARDEAEKALAMYSDLYDFAPVGYMTFDRNGTICTANLTVAALLGIERSNLIGRRFGQFIAQKGCVDFSAFLDRVFAGQAKETFEVALLNGEALLLMVRIEAIADVSGRECRAAILDVSTRKQLEEKLDGLHAELSRRAADLEDANAELEAFNYSVSHDLRGPLTIIAGYCDLIEAIYGSLLDRKCREYFQTILETTMSMNRLIDTLINFSRVNRIGMHKGKVDLSHLAEEVAKTLKKAEPERCGSFLIATGITAAGDASLLQVVLENLLGNAWKYSRKTDETLVEFGVKDVGGTSTYFIRDNGCGFDVEKAEKLFIPFQRLPGTEVEGHGIGLATVDRIVRRHGGRVWAESKPGEGATFFFTLA